MSTDTRERYSLRSECRHNGSCSCRNALDSMPASTRRMSKRRRSGDSRTLAESSETSEFSDYGSISPGFSHMDTSSDSNETSSESDSDSIVYENCHTFTSRSIKRVTFSDIINYNYESTAGAGGHTTGTPKKSLSNGAVKPRTILVSNNHSSNGIKSSDNLKSHQSCNSVITAEAAEMSTKSSRSWGETACATLKIIGFPVYYLLLMGFVVEKWFLDIFAGGGGGSRRSASTRMKAWWNGGVSSNSNRHGKYVDEDEYSYNNGDGQQSRYSNGLYYSNLKSTPTLGAAGGLSNTYGNGNYYSTRSKVVTRGRSSSRDVDVGVNKVGSGRSAFRTGFQSSTIIKEEEGWITRCWKSLTERNWWGAATSTAYNSLAYDDRNNKNASATSYGFHTGNGLISEDDDDEDCNFIQSNLGVVTRRNRNLGTRIKNKVVEANYADVDSYDEDDEELVTALKSSGGIGIWGFLWRLMVILGIMGAMIFAGIIYFVPFFANDFEYFDFLLD